MHPQLRTSKASVNKSIGLAQLLVLHQQRFLSLQEEGKPRSPIGCWQMQCRVPSCPLAILPRTSSVAAPRCFSLFWFFSFLRPSTSNFLWDLSTSKGLSRGRRAATLPLGRCEPFFFAMPAGKARSPVSPTQLQSSVCMSHAPTRRHCVYATIENVDRCSLLAAIPCLLPMPYPKCTDQARTQAPAREASSVPPSVPCRSLSPRIYRERYICLTREVTRMLRIITLLLYFVESLSTQERVLDMPGLGGDPSISTR